MAEEVNGLKWLVWPDGKTAYVTWQPAVVFLLSNGGRGRGAEIVGLAELKDSICNMASSRPFFVSNGDGAEMVGHIYIC